MEGVEHAIPSVEGLDDVGVEGPATQAPPRPRKVPLDDCGDITAVQPDNYGLRGSRDDSRGFGGGGDVNMDTEISSPPGTRHGRLPRSAPFMAVHPYSPIMHWNVSMFPSTAMSYPSQPFYLLPHAHSARYPRSQPPEVVPMDCAPDSNSAENQEPQRLRLHRPSGSSEKHLKEDHDRSGDATVETEAAKKRQEFTSKLAEENQLLKAELEAASVKQRKLLTQLEKEYEEKLKLKYELEEARDHIFGLQFGLKDLTPKEVAGDFDELVNGVSEWVEKLMNPILDTPGVRDVVLADAKKHTAESKALKIFIQTHHDIESGLEYPDTDIDTIIAIIMRYLTENIFQTPLMGCLPGAASLLGSIESSMQQSVFPKQDLYARRTWSAQAYNALLCSREYKNDRERQARELATGLAELLRPLYRDDDERKLKGSCRDFLIYPAIALQEKLLVSVHHFYIDLNPYVVFTQDRKLITSSQLFDNLDELQLENLMENRRALNVAKLEPAAKSALWNNLEVIVTVAPGLCMRQVGRGNDIKDPVYVRRQHMLIAFAGPEKRTKYMKGTRSLMHAIYHAQRDRYAWTTKLPGT